VKVDRSIAEGPETALSETKPANRLTIVVVGLLLVLAALALYAVSNPVHDNLYNHFVWRQTRSFTAVPGSRTRSMRGRIIRPTGTSRMSIRCSTRPASRPGRS